MTRIAYVARPRGFCAGVVRAIDIVETALRQYGSPVYMKHAIVHNPTVVEDMERKGAVFVESVDDIPEGATAVFSAHGSPPEDYELAAERRIRVIDGVCPLVTRVHNEAKKYGREDRAVVVIGHADHVEVQGTRGQALLDAWAVTVVDPDRPDSPKLSPDTPVAVLTQTTLSQADVKPAMDALKAHYSDIIVRDDICYATTNRQAAVSHLVTELRTAIVFVVGSRQSSNSMRLVETARRHGAGGILIETPEYAEGMMEQFEIIGSWGPATEDWISRIGVTSGASTPESAVEKVLEVLSSHGYGQEEVEVIEEDVHFKMPVIGS